MKKVCVDDSLNLLFQYIHGESQNLCHCAHATIYKFVFIKKNIGFSSH